MTSSCGVKTKTDRRPICQAAYCFESKSFEASDAHTVNCLQAGYVWRCLRLRFHFHSPEVRLPVAARRGRRGRAAVPDGTLQGRHFFFGGGGENLEYCRFALQCVSVSLYLHCALSCAVYCNRPCLFVCLFVGPLTTASAQCLRRCVASERFFHYTAR